MKNANITEVPNSVIPNFMEGEITRLFYFVLQILCPNNLDQHRELFFQRATKRPFGVVNEGLQKQVTYVIDESVD